MALARRHVDNATMPLLVPVELEEPAEGDEGISYSYRLHNEGKGPALNVEHGVELSGTRLSFGEGVSPYKFRTVREGQVVPPPHDPDVTGEAGSIDPLVVNSSRHDPERVYWARYQSMHGETFEARNSYNPSSDLRIRRISRARLLLARLIRTRPLTRGRGLRQLAPSRWAGQRAELDGHPDRESADDSGGPSSA